MILPSKIFRRGKDEIGFEWIDGTKSVFHVRDLRLACPCALCVDETSGKKLLDPATVPADISIESIESIGRYAVGILWSDGHRTGIYTYELLKRLTAGLTETQEKAIFGK